MKGVSMTGQADLTHQDVMRILQIVDETDAAEVLVEYGGMKLHVQKGAGAQGASLDPGGSTQPVVPAHPPAPAVETGSEPIPTLTDTGSQQPAALPEGAVVIRSPMLGRFFRAPSPTEPPFVEVGSRITADQTVGLIEVMKLFNNVKAGVGGTVVEIRTANEEMVEEDQILFVVQPD